MKTHISQLQLRGFKSFNRKIDLVFQPGMNCIIGANGSGKSNLLDAMCFVLGRLSSKDLRADNFADLLFRRKTTIASEGDVTFVFDNSSKVFPVDAKFVEVKRKIKKKGQTQYKVNGRNATRQQVLELLSAAKVFPGGHNIILQGDIAHFVDMKSVERRQIVEEIAGIYTYEQRKGKALQELAKVDEKLKEASIVLREKGEYMKNLEAEKEGAEKYKIIQDELKSAQATEIHMRMQNAEAKSHKILGEVDKRTNNLQNLKLDIDIAGKKIAQFKENLQKLEKDIQKKGGVESLELQKGVENIRVDLEKARTLISSSLNEIERIKTRKTDLEKSLSGIGTKIKDKEKEKSELETELSLIKKQEASLKKDLGTSDLKELEGRNEKLEKELEGLNSERSNLQSNIKILENNLQNIEEKLAEIKAREEKLGNLKDVKSKYQKISSEIQQLANRDSKLALDSGELKKELIAKEEELAKVQVRNATIQEVIASDRALGLIFKKKISGVLGTVAELGKVDSEYAVALKIAAGNRMKNIVVENSDTAIKCLNALKEAKAGVATFLPLDKLKHGDDSPKEIQKKPGVIGPAADLITTESKYKNLFKYIFRNTIIVKDVASARAIGIAKCRMVTLDGDLFEPSGAITGGFRTKGGVGFEDTRVAGLMVKVEADLQSLQANLRSLQSEREEIEKKLMEQRTEKAELEGKVEIAKLSDTDSGDIEGKSSEIKSEITDVQKQLKKLEEEISEKLGERNAVKSKVHELQFGEQRKEVEDILGRKTAIESQLATISATIEHGLLPEKENINNVLKGLDKESKTFDKQIREQESVVKNFESALEKKEKEQDSFHGKLKGLFDEQNNLSQQLRNQESEYNALLLKLNTSEQERNNFAVEKAQYDAELAALKQEFEPYATVAVLEIKTIDAARNKIRDLSNKLQNIGNVNMRALEVFDAVKQEYSELANRTQTLDKEKNDVLSIIDEIEKKKTEAFMKTYTGMANKFAEIHRKIATKNHANLELENPLKPFEGGVVVRVTDLKGKKASLASLSGGEKVLVALALIFAVQEHEPAPFYLLDEIDAALDKVNSEKVALLLKEYSRKAQVIIISHNDAVISEADNLYGVSMTKEGESSIVSLKL